MGIFHVQCVVQNPGAAGRTVSIPKALVDTGAEYSWIPEAELRKIRVTPRKKDISFMMANGQTITRDIGYAILRVDTFETIDEVVFAKPGDLTLLGARTMEGFAATVDPRKKKLVAAGPISAA